VGFYRVWQLAQIGHKQEAPLPPSTSLYLLVLPLLKGGTKARTAKGFDCSCLEEKRRVCMLLTFSTGCSRASARVIGVREVGWLIKRRFLPPGIINS